MSERTLIAMIRKDETDPDRLVIASPAVGLADGALRDGIYLNPLDRVATIKVLNRRHVLRLPRDAHGRISEVLIPPQLTPVSYGQALARLDPAAGPGGASEGEPDGAADPDAGSEAGLVAVRAPSEGIFYRRASPEAEPYVSEGTEVTAGAVLGLVEVMKSFNAITYGGPGLPERGEVAEILVEDAAEVAFGEVLFRVRPSG